MTDYRSEKAVAERIRQVEARHDLFQYRIDGWCAWRLLRFPVSTALRKLPWSAPAPGETWRRSERLAIAARHLPGLLAPRRARHVVKTFSSARGEQEGGRYKDIYFDDLLQEIGSFFKIEALNKKEFISRSQAALIPSDITTATLHTLNNLLHRVGGRPRDILPISQYLSDCIHQELGLEAFTPERIGGALLKFYWLKRLYAWLLRRIRPEYVLVADTSEFAIMAAAKEQGIKPLEFQHGIFTRYHPDALPASAVAYKDDLLVPDRILLYGQYWKQELEANGFYDQELRSVGSVRVDSYRKRRVVHKSSKQDDVCTLVLTTQGLDTERLIAFVADFLTLAEKQLDFLLYVKLHPIYEHETSKAVYEAVCGMSNHVRVLLGTEAPSTFELLVRADFHISIASACHYDALGLGVPTVILPLANHEIVLHLYEAGHAFLAQSPQDLLDIVLNRGNYELPREVSDWYFEPGALENIKRELGIPS